MDLVEVPEIVVTSVEDVMRILLVRYLWHYLAVKNRSGRNMHVCRDLRLNIIQGMHLDATFMFAAFGPPEHLEAQVDGRGIEGVNVGVQVENLDRTFLSGNLDHVESELLENVVIPVFVSLGKVAAGYAFPHPEVVKFSLMSLKIDDQIA